MASTSSTLTSSQFTFDQSAISISSTLSLPKTCTKHVTSKIENLVEYLYVPDSAQVSKSSMPLISPYQLYRCGNTFTRSIRTLISTKRPTLKEHVQSSCLDQCALQATQAEQYVTLEIPTDLIAQWQREGYTHLHLGGVRLILTLHGRKDTETIPTIVQIPRQIPKHELLKLMPMEWLSNYEKFHQNSQPIYTSEAFFEKRDYGTVKMTFQPPSEPTAPRTSFSYTSMITVVSIAQENIPIHSFSSKGYPIYPDKLDGHFLWDVPQNAVVQNQAITTLHHKVDNITHKTNQVERKVDTISDKLNQIYQNLHDRVTQLDSELRAMLAQRVYSPDFDKKEADIRALKAEIARIDSEKVQPTLFTSSAPLSVINPTYHHFLPSTSSRTYDPSKRFDPTAIDESAADTEPTAPAPDPTPRPTTEQDDYDDFIGFALDDSSESSDSENMPIIHTVQQLSVSQQAPIPSVKLHLLLSKFDKPISLIGFIDTGAQRSMLNPSILPSHCWKNHTEYFRAANGQLFQTNLITKKPVGIQFFPNCVLWVNIVGSDLPDKDLLIGFDILHLIKKLQITASGIRFKQMFQPYTNVLRLFVLSDTPPPYTFIKNQLLPFCLESHNLFSHSIPLRKNQDFFIKLPFKLNKYINPTKGIHPGMTPSDLKLAQAECSQLLAQGLIEPAYSDWACQAFYVEKRSELLRGKKRLVIDYQPLNCFLKDDKFPLPKIRTLFVHICDAKIFSKFDLKARFWQFGIYPSDRHKTAFCIPNAHYQWTVMPFGLKNCTIDEIRNEMRADFNSQAQSVSNLEKMVGQLASSVQTLAMTVEKGKFPSQLVPNPKGVHEVSTSSPQQHREVKAVMTLRKGKEIDNKVEMPVTKTNQIVLVNAEDSSSEEKEETDPREYVPKAPFPQRLAKGKKEKSTGEIFEIFKQDSRKHILIILGRPFLATADAHIQCKTGNMQLSFGNMTVELNIFNIAKQPHNADDGIIDVDLIETIIDNTFLSNLSDDPLQTCLTHFGFDFDIDRSVDEVNALLDSAPSMDTNKLKLRVEQLAPSEKKLITSSESPPKLELKPLPNTLEYAFLGEESTLPVIISSSLNDEKGKLLDVLKEHKGALGWTIADIKGINTVDCMHYIHLDENAKPTREMQRQLNPNMKEVVRTKVLKLLDACIIYPISDSSWVSLVQVVPKKSGVTVVTNADNDSEKVQPTIFTSFAPLPVINPTYHPFLPSTSSRTYDPSKLFDMTHTLFPLHPRPQSKPKKTPKSVPVQELNN
ncbi:hypothetical protein KPL71_023850 [Citrus sinensis]|uniref:Uncharacterized protein n=1 Tax=Citrus sinensis TaxID=2711 RepID=A0ACB8ILU5_CITSI|nr:hypothetical protein KPL71_023850 [Citrus sinensis]